MKNSFILKIYRGHPGHQYWEEFEITQVPRMNIISALLEIQKNPVNRNGEKVTPVVWESGCLEEVCGSCSMLINGYPRQACSALISSYINDKENTIKLAPFTKFPLIRDLIVDRSVMFENLKQIHGWIDVEDSRGKGFGPLISNDLQEVMYSLSKCMTCGCCSEGCPQVNKKSAFIGPAAVSLVRYYNAHPTAKLSRRKRLIPMMEEGGISECGNAQNCVQVCPKNIPLTDSIAAIGRDVTLEAFKDEKFSDRDK